MRGKDLVKLLKQNGWALDRINVSHHIMIKDDETVSVPCHKTDMRIGSYESLLKQTGLKGGIPMIMYPAIFTEDNGGYCVTFPDLEGCITEGDGLKHAAAMAEEALGGYIASLYDRKLKIPEPSPLNAIKVNSDNEHVVIICSNADKYFDKPKAVKKTLSIPQWLDEIAERQHINFSSVLQEALKAQLNL